MLPSVVVVVGICVAVVVVDVVWAGLVDRPVVVVVSGCWVVVVVVSGCRVVVVVVAACVVVVVVAESPPTCTK